MPRNSIHFEESHTAVVGNFRLLLFFKRFFRPYKKLIFASMALAVCAIGTDLLLPQLLKLVMDRHLMPSARKISLNGGPGAVLAGTYTQALIPCAEEQCYFILSGDLEKIAEHELKKLEDAGMLIPEKFYFTKADAAKSALFDKYESFFYRAGDYLFIPFVHLSKLDKKDLMRLRADDFKGITKIAVLFLAVLACSFLFNFSQIYLVEFASQNIMHDIRSTVFGHIQSRSLAFFTMNPVGRLVTRATNDVQNLHEMFNALFANILKDIFLILGIMAVLFIINWKLSLVCFAVLPFLVCCMVLFSVKSRKAFREVRIKIAAINAQIQENISGISVVKSFCREERNGKNFRRLNQDYYLANMKQTLIFAVFNPFVDLSRLSAIALIIWYGGGQAVREAMTLGTLVVFLYYMRMFFRPIQDLAEKYNIIQSALASLERIYLLLNDKNMIADPTQPKKPATIKGDIEFSDVSFSYNPNEPVLQNVSFSVRQGETVAIVGPTGAGKTTIINLLVRSYDVQQGSIRIDGIEISAMEKAFLRSRIGLVMQDVFLFAGTIRSNITLGNKSFSDEDIQKALKTANADRIVARLANGIDADVKEGGKTLSAGERQLLSFARAVLINPKILILDEATSNIDPLTESLIQDALEKLMEKRTSLVIAHRFSTIQKADRIIVMHKGRIHEQGTHAELFKKQGLYYKLYQLQYMN